MLNKARAYDLRRGEVRAGRKSLQESMGPNHYHVLPENLNGYCLHMFSRLLCSKNQLVANYAEQRICSFLSKLVEIG